MIVYLKLHRKCSKITFSAFKCSPMDLSLFAGLAHQSNTSKEHIKKKNISKNNLRRIAVPEARQNTLRKQLEKHRCVPPKNQASRKLKHVPNIAKSHANLIK